ncbi:protein APCDD1-like [Ylistrum balloti]|uniref:protein APCDD1-like n=1 Tax=Ylistrum balloti TaxID=509963 RepID=UPI002905A413|nr:protein APCDD1-like [Ylistrum balloti]
MEYSIDPPKFLSIMMVLRLTYLTLAQILVSAISLIGGTASYNSPTPSCKALARHARDFPVTAPSPPSIHGVWVSDQCEIRPGPEFLLRKYRFKRGKFQLHQYYYSGPDCSVPLYSVKAQGTIKLLRPSWIVPGAMEAKYRLHNVSIIPFQERIAKEFRRKVREQCPEVKSHPWKPYHSYQIMNFPPYKKFRLYKHRNVDYDCTHVFNLTFHELQLLRVEIRRQSGSVDKNKISTYPSRYSKSFEEVDLLLGDIHTDRKQRHTYRPSSYQTALRNSKTKTCQICNGIANSNDYYPPKIDRQKPSKFRLHGDWVSTGCETRQYGQFLTRKLSFLSDGKSWQGQYDFFEDPICRKGSFSLSVKGTYTGDKVSKIIPGSKEYNFRLIRLKVTPKNKQMVNTLRLYDGHCGVRNAWKINEQQDVTSTGGCDVLGIILPNVEFEILRMVVSEHQTLLYVGQWTMNSHPIRSKQSRPTSFQQPLVRCSDSVAKHASNKIEVFLSDDKQFPVFAKFEAASKTNGVLRVEASFLAIFIVVVNVIVS